MERLAEFVGRLYLLLIAVVLDHPKWLPRGLRDHCRAALDEIYPAVYHLQVLLYSGGRDDPRP